MLRNKKGFTLIELMIVVVIIGILAAIAMPNFYAMESRARESSVKANMHSLQLAIEDFAATNSGLYPVAVDIMGVKANMPAGVWPTNPFTNVVDEAPTWGADPAHGTACVHNATSHHTAAAAEAGGKSRASRPRYHLQ